ncbi:MAG: DUF4091 domain-containing protein [Clostridia bacterium]|nr:DUF4091 domain-containing protein [Clostridia bacterium]
MLRAILIPSLEKVFLDTKIDTLEPLRSANAYRNSTFSFQIAMTETACDAAHRRFVGISLDGIEQSAVSLRTVELIPSYMPAYPTRYDTAYVRTEPGLYPDLLQPLQMEGRVPCVMGQTRTVWVDIDTSALSDGKHDIAVNIIDGEATYTLKLALNVIPASLPEVDFPVTQWFHYDCLASYYNVPVFSERHWEIVENFIKTFVKCGNNTLLTPVFTPALDTYIGGERPTVQLVGVARDADGKYTFDFSLLTRFMDMADRLGIKYFEIAHFFTQWGASHAPKVMAATPNGYERIFGWDTDATGEEYTTFIRQFITELLDFLKARGDDKRCFFHISDEPQLAHLEQYMKSKNSVVDLLDGYVIMDALSNVDFYRQGIIKNPIPCNNHIEPFLEAYAEEGREDLWTYYCCSQNKHVSNRFFGYPGARTRYIGVQFYRYKISGFLQWGYNFYYNQGSHDLINPYIDSTGNYFVPSGDTYSVYPAADGTALESVRILHFREGLDDMRALYLAESLVGREKVLEVIEPIVKEMTGENIVFARCIDRSSDMMKLREKIDEIVMNALN